VPSSTTRANADFAQWKVEVIMDNNEVTQTDIEFPYQPANCLSTLVHVGLGSGHYHLIAGYLTRASSGFPLLLIKPYALCPGKVVHTHKPQVVEAISITSPWIT
jgi:hypothetical protein